MPKVGDEHKQNRRMQILQAAFECFGTKGFHQTSMRDICNRAELSIGAVYNYFKGKEAIIEAMAEESRNTNHFLFQGIQATDSKKAAFKKILQNISDVLQEQHQKGELKMKIRLWSEAQENEKLHAIFTENYADLEKKISQCLNEHTSEAKEDNPLSNEHIAQIIIAQYVGLVLQMTLRNDVNPKKSMDQLSQLLGPE